MKHLRTVTAMLVLAAVMCVTVFAYTSELSYGISVLRSAETLGKCGVRGEAAVFSAADFTETLGTAPENGIVIVSIPEESAGKLYLGSLAVTAGQTVAYRDIDDMCFVPADENSSYAEFTFRDAAESPEAEVKCAIHLLEAENSSPVAGGSSFETQKNILLYGTLPAYDPDGDGMSFELRANSKKGSVRFLDKAAGSFVYTPAAGYTGKDSFTYCVTDVYGNSSDTVTVSLKVEKAACDIYYADLAEHPAHNDAVKLAASGLLTGECIGGVNYFYPDAVMTRADFLKLAMQASGLAGGLAEVSATPFADDVKIAVYDKPYVAAAAEAGIVRGSGEGASAVFRASDPITFAEAATMLDRLISPPEALVTGAFFSEGSASHWAAQASVNLVSSGFADSIPPDLDAPVTRAQAAGMLAEMLG